MGYQEKTSLVVGRVSGCGGQSPPSNQIFHGSTFAKTNFTVRLNLNGSGSGAVPDSEELDLILEREQEQFALGRTECGLSFTMLCVNTYKILAPIFAQTILPRHI